MKRKLSTGRGQLLLDSFLKPLKNSRENNATKVKACTDAGYIIDDGAGLAGTTGERLARKKAEHLQDSASKSDLENMPVSNKMCKRKNTRQWSGKKEAAATSNSNSRHLRKRRAVSPQATMPQTNLEEDGLSESPRKRLRKTESLDNSMLVAKSPPAELEASSPETSLSFSNDTSASSSSDSSSSSASWKPSSISSPPSSPNRNGLSNLKMRFSRRKSGYSSPKKAISTLKRKYRKRKEKGLHKDATPTVSSTAVDEISEDQALPRVQTVSIGGHELDPPYKSPLPLELVSKGHVYVCEKCLEFKQSCQTLKHHVSKCPIIYPPGDEIFRQDDLSVFEVDGEISREYCQSLCLFAKLFIDSKTLFYDVEPFLFYVLVITDAHGCHIAGYFSKQKNSVRNNLSCLLVIPCYQSKGYGRFLIEFSYLLSRRENKSGTPERPLSDMGTIAYRSYWRGTLLEFFHELPPDHPVCIDDIVRKTGIAIGDVIQTLYELGFFELHHRRIRSVVVLEEMIKANWLKAKNDKRRIWIDAENLRWEPKTYKLCFDGEGEASS